MNYQDYLPDEVLRILEEVESYPEETKFIFTEEQFPRFVKAMDCVNPDGSYDINKLEMLTGLEATHVEAIKHLEGFWALMPGYYGNDDAVVRYSLSHDPKQWDLFTKTAVKLYYMLPEDQQFLEPDIEDDPDEEDVRFLIPLKLDFPGKTPLYYPLFRDIARGYDHKNIQDFDTSRVNPMKAEMIEINQNHGFSLMLPGNCHRNAAFYMKCVLALYKYFFAMEVTIRTTENSWQSWEPAAAFIAKQLHIDVRQMMQEEIETCRDEIAPDYVKMPKRKEEDPL